MSKKNKQRQNIGGGSPSTPRVETGPALAAIEQTATSLGIEKPDWNAQLFIDLHAALPLEKQSQFQAYLTRFAELGKQVKAAIDEYKERQKQADLALAETVRLTEDLKKQSEAVDKKSRDFEATKETLSTKESELLTQERDLEIRELNAKSGFIQQNRDALELLRSEIARLEKERLELHATLERDRQTAFDRLQQEQKVVRGEQQERTRLLDERDSALTALQEELAGQRRRLDIDKRSREQLEEFVRKQLSADYAAEIQAKDTEIAKVKERSRRLGEQLDTANARIDEFATLAEQLGGKAPTELVKAHESLRRELHAKEMRIVELEEARSRDDYDSIRAERDRLVEENRAMRPELEELRQRNHAVKIGVLEKEQWAQEKRVLEKNKQLLSTLIDDLETRLDSLTNAQQAQSAFPELSRMDTESKFTTPAAVEPVGDLKAFTEGLQQRIAVSQPDNPLYFRLEDLQLLVGGLAMSQLHILQGISGTGKTSLAKALAYAVGGECTDIAVQAGWRDRGDLLGHYNAFEKRYYEKDCLQALYRAQTPFAEDRVNIILLDELNLSRPEQYFADFLSALEKDPRHRRIPLMESAPQKHPLKLENGREIVVTENVWFIGTANQDETTNELADKTHDRAFVMELPRHEMSFKIKEKIPQVKYSFSALKKAFRDAQVRDKVELQKALRFIGKSDLTKELEERFGIGWGNRFERQALKFLPVVKAAGGKFEDALDHLLASRLFRSGKVTGRYDIKAEDLDVIEKALLKTLEGVFPGIVPDRCLHALEEDRKRLERRG